MNTKIIERAGEIIAQRTGAESHCALALIDAEGYPTISTISASKADGIRWITFCTGLSSAKADRIRGCGRASVCFQSGEYNITLVGQIEILIDPETKKAMWYQGLSNHFAGPEDPNYCVLRFQTRRYNLLVDWEEASGIL